MTKGPFRSKRLCNNGTNKDELIGDIVKALPKEYDFCAGVGPRLRDGSIIFPISDNRLPLQVRQQVLNRWVGLSLQKDATSAAWLPGSRPVSSAAMSAARFLHGELVHYAPGLADAMAAFEPAPHVQFGRSERDVPREPPPEKGDHGFWPFLRDDYRSVFFRLSGPGIRPGALGSVEMISLEARLATPLGLRCLIPQ